jgi:hypothetical protein
MNMRSVKTKFEDSWDDIAMHDVSQDWRDIMKSYVIEGFDPGSFFVALLANDLMAAAAKSHELNSWKQIRGVVKWLYNRAPGQCYGSHEKVKAWLALSKDERRKINEGCKLLATAWELLAEQA